MSCSKSVGRFVVFVAGMLITPSAASAQTTWYVDDDATSNGVGTTWNTAFRYAQDGLAIAANGDEIRVAQGTYKPDQDAANTNGTGNRSATFQLLNGVELKGGYAGIGAPDPDLRDVDSNASILSGDLAANDGPDFTNYEENSYHVVTGNTTDSTAILDGFTITAGYADGPNVSTEKYGAGMFNVNASCTVAYCTFLANATESYSGDGAGMYNEGGAPAVTDCTFIGNTTRYSSSDGAGIYNDNSNATITRCTFIGNSAERGGGISSYQGTPMISDCTFSGNSAPYGGAMRNNYSDSWVINCRFFGNSSSSAGGAVYNTYDDPKFINCIFVGNTSLSYGGASYSYSSDPTFTNCVFVGNSSTLREAGGICNSASNPLLTNCIVWGNRGAYGTTPDAQIYSISDPYDPSVPIVNHSCIQGGWTGAGGIGNIEVAARFAREPYDGGDGWGVGDNDDFGDLHLTAGSACIDVGDNDADTDQIAGGIQPLPATDLDGNARIVDDPIAPDAGTPPVVDMGAYEYQADCNTNALMDSVDIHGGTSPDCNSNGIPDECEPPDDCNDNAVQDICDLAGGTGADCNRNGMLDECDIRDGVSSDVNSNAVPDACERDLTGYWQFDFAMDTGCYIIDEYLTERRYLRFDETDGLIEGWIETGAQHIKLNYPSTDGPSYNRFRLNGLHTANTDRTITTLTFAPHAGVLHCLENVSVTDSDYVDPSTEEGSENGYLLLDGEMDAAGTSMQGTWWFFEGHTLCGPFTATKLTGSPPAFPTVIDLEVVGLVLSTTDLVRPGATDVVQREYRVRSSFLDEDVEVRYLLSTNGIADANDLVIGSETIHTGSNGLLGLHAAPGPTLLIPECVRPPDGYFVLAMIDAAEVITETDESNNVFALAVTIIPPPLLADFDCDGDVDLDDYEIFEVCLWFSGPAEPPPFAECLNVFDLDSDADVDLADFGEFQVAFTG